MSPDAVNGLFELVGAVFILLNIARLRKDRRLNGVHWLSTTYFTSWGLWNLFYYPHLGQWYSFLGGCVLVATNTAWLIMLAWYSLNDQLDEPPSPALRALMASKAPWDAD